MEIQFQIGALVTDYSVAIKKYPAGWSGVKARKLAALDRPQAVLATTVKCTAQQKAAFDADRQNTLRSVASASFAA